MNPTKDQKLSMAMEIVAAQFCNTQSMAIMDCISANKIDMEKGDDRELRRKCSTQMQDFEKCANSVPKNKIFQTLAGYGHQACPDENLNFQRCVSRNNGKQDECRVEMRYLFDCAAEKLFDEASRGQH